MSPAHWGPPTWLLLHAIVERLNASCFPAISQPLFYIISQICKNLPCPECTTHATAFLNTVKMNTIQTKGDFRMMLLFFHNKVNVRKMKPVSDVSILDKYASVNLHIAFSLFVAEYTKQPSNLRLRVDSNIRKLVVNNSAQWLNKHQSLFIVNTAV